MFIFVQTKIAKTSEENLTNLHVSNILSPVVPYETIEEALNEINSSGLYDYDYIVGVWISKDEVPYTLVELVAKEINSEFPERTLIQVIDGKVNVHHANISIEDVAKLPSNFLVFDGHLNPISSSSDNLSPTLEEAELRSLLLLNKSIPKT